MLLYQCTLTFHDNLFYETRTLGRLYETGRLLHNIALCYALGFATTSFYHGDDIPRYAEELAELNQAGIYVTPARGDDVRYVVHTFKLGDEAFGISADTVQDRRNKNRPSFGRAKEVAIGSRFAFGVLSEAPIALPQWIRMGIWSSKAFVSQSAPISLQLVRDLESTTISDYPLNPGDLPGNAQIRLFDLVSMRPTSLIENALIAASEWWQWKDEKGHSRYLPVGLQHRIEVGR